MCVSPVLICYDVVIRGMFDVGAESVVSVWVENGTVKFPDSVDVPVIMVGPGTGCAPFRSFIQERALRQISGYSATRHLLAVLYT